MAFSAAFCQGFRYDALEEETIRTIRFTSECTPKKICCSITHQKAYHLRGAIPYTALSYCWGAAHMTPILLNGHDFLVTNNLRDALISLHSYDPTKSYWIDAICINQLNIKERNAQVHQMWRVYASAELVISWLGPSDEISNIAFDAFEKFEPIHAEQTERPSASVYSTFICQRASDNGTQNSDLVPILQATVSLSFPREYFSRAWVISQVMQAADVILMCGDQTCGWQAMDHFLRRAVALDGTGPLYKFPLMNSDEHRRHIQTRKLFQAREARFKKNHYTSPRDHHQRFLDVLRTFSLGRCSDVRDKVFASLGDPRIKNIGRAITIVPDYSLTVPELYVQVLKQDYSLAEVGAASTYESVHHILDRSLGLDIFSPTYSAWTTAQIESIEIENHGFNEVTTWKAALRTGGHIFLPPGIMDPHENRHDLKQLRSLRISRSRDIGNDGASSADTRQNNLGT